MPPPLRSRCRCDVNVDEREGDAGVDVEDAADVGGVDGRPAGVADDSEVVCHVEVARLAAVLRRAAEREGDGAGVVEDDGVHDGAGIARLALRVGGEVVARVVTLAESADVRERRVRLRQAVERDLACISTARAAGASAASRRRKSRRRRARRAAGAPRGGERHCGVGQRDAWESWDRSRGSLDFRRGETPVFSKQPGGGRALAAKSWGEMARHARGMRACGRSRPRARADAAAHAKGE